MQPRRIDFLQNLTESERQLSFICLSIERQHKPKVHLFKKRLFQNLEKIILCEK
jgi:hypothetical protein